MLSQNHMRYNKTIYALFLIIQWVSENLEANWFHENNIFWVTDFSNRVAILLHRNVIKTKHRWIK